MKKKIVTLLTGLLALSLVACGKTSSNSTDEVNEPVKEETKTEEIKEPEVTQSGYSIIDGYLYFGFTLSNPNNKGYLEFPTVTITAKGEDGSILGTTDQTMGDLKYGDSVSFGSMFEVTGDPANVEFTAHSSGLLKSIPEDQDIPSDTLKVDNLSETPGEWDTKYTGEVENIGETDIESAAVTILLKKDGQIVYGTTSYVDHIPAGQKKAFDISIYSAPEHTEYEVTSHFWW